MSLMMFLLVFFYKCKHLTRNQVIPSPLRGCFLMKMQQAAKIALMRIKYFMPKAILAQRALFSKKMIGFSLMSL